MDLDAFEMAAPASFFTDKPTEGPSISPSAAQAKLLQYIVRSEDDLVAQTRIVLHERPPSAASLSVLEDMLIEAVQEASAVFHKFTVTGAVNEAWAALQRIERLVALYDGSYHAEASAMASRWAPRKTFIERRPSSAKGRPASAVPSSSTPSPLISLGQVTIDTCKGVIRELYRSYEHQRQAESGHRAAIADPYLQQKEKEAVRLITRVRPTSVPPTLARNILVGKDAPATQSAKDAMRSSAVPAHQKTVAKPMAKKPVRPASASSINNKHYARPLARFTNAPEKHESEPRDLATSGNDLGFSQRDGDRYYGKARFGPARPASASSSRIGHPIAPRPPTSSTPRLSTALDIRPDSAEGNALIAEDVNECDDGALDAAFASNQLRMDPRRPSASGGSRPSTGQHGTTGRPLSSSLRRNWRAPTPVEVYLAIDGSTAPDEGEKSLIEFLGLVPKSNQEPEKHPLADPQVGRAQPSAPEDMMDDILRRVRLAGEGLGHVDVNNADLNRNNYFHASNVANRTNGNQSYCDRFSTPQSPFAKIQQVLANTARRFLARRHLLRRQQEIAKANELRPFLEERAYYSQKMDNHVVDDLLAIAYYEKQTMVHTQSIEHLNAKFHLDANIAEAAGCNTSIDLCSSNTAEGQQSDSHFEVRPPSGTEPLQRAYPFESQKYAWETLNRSKMNCRPSPEIYPRTGMADPIIEPTAAAPTPVAMASTPRGSHFGYNPSLSCKTATEDDRALDEDIIAAKVAFDDFRKILRRAL